MPSAHTEGMERHVAAVEDACSRASNGLELFSMLSEGVRKVVPVDGSAWASSGGPLAATVILDEVAAAMTGPSA